VITTNKSPYYETNDTINIYGAVPAGFFPVCARTNRR
jgi:hypothetical protein